MVFSVHVMDHKGAGALADVQLLTLSLPSADVR